MDWIEAFKKDEDKALRLLYTEVKEPCISWLIKTYKLNVNDATEIFQLSVIILFENIRSGKLQKLSSNVKTYIYSIAKNKVMELLRTYRDLELQDNTQLFFAKYLIDESEVDIKKELELRFENSLLMLDEIGDPCKSLLNLFYFDGYSISQITKEMGYKNNDTTKNIKYKCLKRLQSMVLKHKEQIS